MAGETTVVCFHPVIFQKRREKKTEKEKRKLSFLAVLGRAVKVFAKKILPEHTPDILRIVRVEIFFAKFILTLIARWS
jgi:hypothetical protein